MSLKNPQQQLEFYGDFVSLSMKMNSLLQHSAMCTEAFKGEKLVLGEGVALKEVSVGGDVFAKLNQFQGKLRINKLQLSDTSVSAADAHVAKLLLEAEKADLNIKLSNVFYFNAIVDKSSGAVVSCFQASKQNPEADHSTSVILDKKETLVTSNMDLRRICEFMDGVFHPESGENKERCDVHHSSVASPKYSEDDSSKGVRKGSKKDPEYYKSHSEGLTRDIRSPRTGRLVGSGTEMQIAGASICKDTFGDAECQKGSGGEVVLCKQGNKLVKASGRSSEGYPIVRYACVVQ